MSKDEVKKNREEYLNDAKAFLMVDCDCELYQFEEIPDAIDTLKEYVQWQEEDEEVTLSKDISLIPFAHNSGGDLYCFLYSDETDEPSVVLYYHDEYGNPEIVGHDFDEFVYVQLLQAVENEEDIEDEYFQNQIMYLSDTYRDLVIGKDADTLLDDLDSIEVEEAEIWC